MQRLIVQRSTLCGALRIPPSKSQTMRALLFASLAKGESTIDFPLWSPDTEAMILACQGLGAVITKEPNRLMVRGVGGNIALQMRKVDVGNSGIAYRFITALAALGNDVIRITGDASIQHQRPIQPLLNALQQLGARVWYHEEEGRAPFSLCGPIHGGRAVLSGEDSQPVSALLIVSSFLNEPVEIYVRNPGERPWVGLTLHWLHSFGIPITHHNFSSYRIQGGKKIPSFHYRVPGDFSAAAFPMAAAMLTESDMTLSLLDWEDPQGDKLLFSALEQMGARFRYSHAEQQIHISGRQTLQGMDLPVNQMIDALPILGVIGCHIKGKMELLEGAIARKKECDRIGCLTQELQKMGAHITATDAGIVVKPSSLKGGVVQSHGDHRLAMALAVAGMTAEGTTIIEGAECIQKSFPGFVETMKNVGANIALL